VPQAKSDRSAAAKKAAATRQRNREHAQAQQAGKKAAATRERRAASDTAEESVNQARQATRGAVAGLAASARLAGQAAKLAGRAASNTISRAGKESEK
jgi:hypothetical protein